VTLLEKSPLRYWKPLQQAPGIRWECQNLKVRFAKEKDFSARMPAR